MAELIAVLIIAGVLAAVAVPRMTSTSASFDEVRLYDQTLAALRYAQKTAVTQQRTVCATFTATQLTLAYRSAYGPGAGVCDTNLNPPAGGPGGQYTVVAQGSAVYSAATSFNYDRVGRPNILLVPIAAPIVISINGDPRITIEPETGYVR